MKNLFTLFFVGSLALVSCGPSAEDQKAGEQAKNDSIAAAEQQNNEDAKNAQHIADSIAKAENTSADTTHAPAAH
jgi:septal ring factor EnvC (AmiA/AmiB activator)